MTDRAGAAGPRSGPGACAVGHLLGFCRVVVRRQLLGPEAAQQVAKSVAEVAEVAWERGSFVVQRGHKTVSQAAMVAAYSLRASSSASASAPGNRSASGNGGSGCSGGGSGHGSCQRRRCA